MGYEHQNLVAVACFLPGWAKDLSAPLHSNVHSVNIKSKYSLRKMNATRFKKSLYQDGIKIFNSLPSSCKITMKSKEIFKTRLNILKKTHSFYGADEFFIFKNYSVL